MKARIDITSSTKKSYYFNDKQATDDCRVYEQDSRLNEDSKPILIMEDPSSSRFMMGNPKS